MTASQVLPQVPRQHSLRNLKRPRKGPRTEENCDVSSSYYSRDWTSVAVGKFFGIGDVTLPVAAHSVPRWRVVAKPTHFMASTLWPRAVWKTRPLPKLITRSSG